MLQNTMDLRNQFRVKMSRDALEYWMEALVNNTNLVAPRLEGGTLLYRAVDSASQIEMNTSRPVMSLKELFFPPAERLFSVVKHGQEVRLVENIYDQPQVVWGVRSCDARGMLVLDGVFLDNEPVDIYYARRRQQITLIGLACREPGPSCFCEKTGGAPDDPTGMDIMIYQEGDHFLVDVLTFKGHQLIEQVGLPDGHSDHIAGISPKRIEPKAALPGDHKMTLQFPEWSGWMDDPYWDETAERCLSCRVCGYVCPTCRCFDIREEALPFWDIQVLAESDRPSPGQGSFERIRCWDSCTGENYRKIGGGHRPRAEKSERLRNRFLCKFYYYPEQYSMENLIACTGCGRCVDSCPVNIDIREVIEHVQGWVGATNMGGISG